MLIRGLCRVRVAEQAVRPCRCFDLLEENWSVLVHEQMYLIRKRKDPGDKVKSAGNCPAFLDGKQLTVTAARGANGTVPVSHDEHVL